MELITAKVIEEITVDARSAAWAMSMPDGYTGV